PPVSETAMSAEAVSAITAQPVAAIAAAQSVHQAQTDQVTARPEIAAVERGVSEAAITAEAAVAAQVAIAHRSAIAGPIGRAIGVDARDRSGSDSARNGWRRCAGNGWRRGPGG